MGIFVENRKTGMKKSVRCEPKELKGSGFLFGRLYCDFELQCQDDTISRLQFVLYFLEDCCLVLDCWSIAGTRTTSRSSDEECLESTPTSRRLLTFGKNETFALEVGACCKITVNAKVCICCCDRPREVRFDCGHSHCCRRCANELNRCPICRAQVLHRIVPNDGGV